MRNDSERMLGLPPNLGIDDATDEQLKKVFSYLVQDIAGQNTKGPMDCLLKVLMHPQWTKRNVSAQFIHAKTYTVTSVQEYSEFYMVRKLKEDGFVQIRVCNPNAANEYCVMRFCGPVE